MITYDTAYNDLIYPSLRICFRYSAEITPDTKLIEEMQLDSLDAVDLLLAIEEKYGQELISPDNKELEDEYRKVFVKGTVGDLTTFFVEVINKKEEENGKESNS